MRDPDYGRFERYWGTMKNFTSAVSALASSLFLNAGFEPLARKIDPLSLAGVSEVSLAHAPAMSYPCSFVPKRQG